MMRALLIFFAFLIGFGSCVKRKTKNPVPVIEYKDLLHARKSEFTNKDTAVMVLGYEDGDGDIFLDYTTQGPNVIFIPWFFNKAANKFEITIDPTTQDTLRLPNSIKQPDNGYYKGKSIKGEIFIPMTEFRPNDSLKIIKFTGFVIDVKGHKSNLVSSPVYTLDF